MSHWFNKTTFHNLLYDTSGKFPENIALISGDRTWTFSELVEQVEKTANALTNIGVVPGDKVAIWMPNSPEWIFSFFAISSIGAIVVPINTRFRRHDIEYILKQSDTKILLTVDHFGPVDYLNILRDCCPEIEEFKPNELNLVAFPELKSIIVSGNSQLYSSTPWETFIRDSETTNLPKKHVAPDSAAPNQTVLMMYTSGTTGFPKGVMHNHNILRTITDAANRMGYTNRDVILMYLPLFHCFGLYEGPLMSITTGCTMVLMERFESSNVLHLIEKYRATVINGFDTHFHDLINDKTLKQTTTSSLRTALFAAGMEATEPIARQAQTLLCPTVTAWGMTEVGVGATRSFLDSPIDIRCKSSGYPLPGYEFKTIDPDTGIQTPYEQPGELCIRGYALMQGYYKKPKETQDAIDSKGWFHSGDVAVISSDTSIRFLGRYKDQLKVGGENVDPIEVEAYLQTHQLIDKVQVVGVPDTRLNEVPCACVVLKPENSIDITDISEYCVNQLASFKIPKYLLIFQEFPMTASGKVQKFKLRELATEQLGIISP